MRTATSFPSQSSPGTPLVGSAWFLALVCLVASLGGLLFGFDTAVISGTVGSVEAQYHLSKLQVGWFTSSALVGCVLGAIVAGALGDRFGRKPILMISAVFLFVSALWKFVPETKGRSLEEIEKVWQRQAP